MMNVSSLKQSPELATKTDFLNEVSRRNQNGGKDIPKKQRSRTVHNGKMTSFPNVRFAALAKRRRAVVTCCSLTLALIHQPDSVSMVSR